MQLLIGVSVIALAIIALVFAASLGGSGERSSRPITTVEPSTGPQSSESVSPDAAPIKLPPTSLGQPQTADSSGTRPADPSRSVVLIELYDSDRLCGTGSGAVYPSAKYIITNEHVVNGAKGCNSIRILRPSDDQSDVLIVGEGRVLGFDNDSDLAVIQIDEPESASWLFALGRADEPKLGDTVTVWAFPAIGSRSVTVTEGLVSGKASSSNGLTFWKTDAALSGGSSGGGVFNSQGQLLGVVSRLSASENGDVVDCRTVADTNGDGSIDEQDSCVPVGGSVGLFVGVDLIDKLLQRLAILQAA